MRAKSTQAAIVAITHSNMGKKLRSIENLIGKYYETLASAVNSSREQDFFFFFFTNNLVDIL